MRKAEAFVRQIIIGVQAHQLAVFSDLSIQVALLPERKAEEDVRIGIIRVQVDGLADGCRGIVPSLLLNKDMGKAHIEVVVLRVKQQGHAVFLLGQCVQALFFEVRPARHVFLHFGLRETMTLRWPQ